MYDPNESEKIANAALHQRADLMARLGRLTDALTDIEELVEGEADVDDGQPNLAMKVLVVVRAAVGKR